MSGQRGSILSIHVQLHCVQFWDCHWQCLTHISHQRKLFIKQNRNNKREREILIQITDWTDLDKSSRSFVRQMTNLWHWSQIILNSGNWERTWSSKTILYNLNWAIPSSAMGVLSSYPFPSQLFLSFHHFLFADDIVLMDKITQMFRKLTQTLSALTVSYLLIEC